MALKPFQNVHLMEESQEEEYCILGVAAGGVAFVVAVVVEP